MSRGFLVERLPEHLASDPFLVRFLGIFQAQADRLEDQLVGIQHVADPSVAPPEVVRWLGGWLGLRGIDPTMPVPRQRMLVRTAGRDLGRRGTASGLRELLTVLTGVDVVVTDTGGVYAEGEAPRLAPCAWIDVPATAAVSATHLLAVVRQELPAGVSFELRLGGEVVWPAGAAWTGAEALRPGAPVQAGKGHRRRREPLRAARVTTSGGGTTP